MILKYREGGRTVGSGTVATIIEQYNLNIDLLSQDNVVSKRKIPVELRFYGFFCCLEIYKR